MGMATTAKWMSAGKNAKNAANRNTRITKGKGATAANASAAIRSKKMSGGLKGPSFQ